MSKQRNYKETVSVIYITKPKQKLRFQIKHPENVEAVIGVAVSCTMIKPKVKTARDIAGLLSISIPQKGDIVFGEAVRIDDNNYLEVLEAKTFGSFFNKSFWFAGKKLDYFKTYYKVDEAIMESFYEDISLPVKQFFKSIYGGTDNIKLSNVKPLNERYYYILRIYLQYKTKASCG